MLPRFPGQKENEIVKHLISKHWIVYVKLVLFLMLTVGTLVGIYLWLELGVNITPNTAKLVTIFFLLGLDFALLVTFIRWLEDEIDIIIVTNERMIFVNQISFMHRVISETELSQIQDVKHVSKGILSNLFNFGSLMVQTAAEKILFEIHHVKDPYNIARRIMDLANQYKRDFAFGKTGGGEAQLKQEEKPGEPTPTPIPASTDKEDLTASGETFVQ
jgi:hypothetical protein